MADEPRVPSGAMYIGLCQLRAQAANLRWQYAIVFMALNAAMGNLCFQLLALENRQKLVGVILIAFAAILVNYLWRGLVDRANQWIEYYTTLLRAIEEKYGTESGVLVFGDERYLSYQEAESLVKGMRFRVGIKRLTDIVLGAWVLVVLSCVLWGTYLVGLGKL